MYGFAVAYVGKVVAAGSGRVVNVAIAATKDINGGLGHRVGAAPGPVLTDVQAAIDGTLFGRKTQGGYRIGETHTGQRHVAGVSYYYFPSTILLFKNGPFGSYILKYIVA